MPVQLHVLVHLMQVLFSVTVVDGILPNPNMTLLAIIQSNTSFLFVDILPVAEPIRGR